MENKISIEIPIQNDGEELKLYIYERIPGTLFIADDYIENLEAEYQIKEGCSYDYEFSNESYSFEQSVIVQPHARKKYLGTISPNFYVGTLQLFVCRNNQHSSQYVKIEVQSLKTDYREDYRVMLEYIAEQCTEILLQVESPVTNYFDVDYTKNSECLYQRFSFIKSIILTDELTEAIHRIVSSPATNWKEETELRDVCKVRRLNNKKMKELVSGGNRSILSENHFLSKYGINSISRKIASEIKIDTIDTPENRFIKYVLEVFLRFCTEIHSSARNYSLKKLEQESDFLQKKLESWLQHTIFKDISRPVSLKINSSILQRKEGYREVLRVWLMFDLAAKLIWEGGEDVYSAGKKDIAVLYEYWLFFVLINLFKSMFKIEPVSITKLIQKTENGLNLNLKQGRHTALEGIYFANNRRLNVHFHYNRSFAGNREYPFSGSWTTTMRPDYTLSFWPAAISEEDAEKQELIVHIHFDAKYKIANFSELINIESTDELDNEKKENRGGIYKNADLLKMHAYKDAIRRTGGAYVLYPGNNKLIKKGFHEIIPGLGAFPVSPSKNDDGISELKEFIYEVINHFCNRASQRERIAYKSFEVYKNNNPIELNEPAPEIYGDNRGLIPDDTFVLVAFYKKENWEWILKKGLYNARTGSDRGSLRLGPGESGARYILLHTENETVTDKLLKIEEIGPRIFSKSQLINLDYPSTPSQEYYLVYKVNNEIEEEFQNIKWNISKLEGFRSGRSSALPFSITLSDLLRSKLTT